MKIDNALRLAAAGTTVLAALLAGACGGGDHDGTGDHDSGAPAASVPADAAYNSADVTFASEMIPHHQQAVEMADIAVARAGDPGVKELATKIQKAQGPEITTMSGWLRDWGKPVPSASPGMGHGEHEGMPGMMTDQEMSGLMAASGSAFDRMFLDMMIRHHEGAIEMARTEQQQGRHPEAKQLAATIATDQKVEILQMQALLTTL